jgi:hypothetical protein
MLDKIRRSVKYFIILIGTVIMLPTVLYLLLQTASVQTFLVKRITKHFSSELKSTISIGSVEYKFFNRLSFHKILIKDKNNDTILYTNSITAGIRHIDFENKGFRLGTVIIVKPVVGLVTDSTGEMNLTWLLNQLKGSGDTTKKSSARFSADRADIIDGRFSLINKNAAKSKTRIDFNNLKLSKVNGRIESIEVFNDTTAFRIATLNFIDTSGFTVKQMSSSVVLAKQNFNFSSTLINCGNSELNIARLGLTGDSASGFKNFIGKVKLDILLDKSQISTTELGYFMTFADSLNETIQLSGRIMGTISELRGRNIKLSYRESTSLDCDFDFSGLPKIENAYLYVGVNSLKTTTKDIGQIRLRKGLIILPDPIKKIGNISFNGSFNGFTTDFVTYGEFSTSEGNVRTDISLRPEGNRYHVKGLLTGKNINLGTLTAKPELLGNVSLKTNIDGYAYSFKKFAANLTGKVDSIEFNKYEYRNISLNGMFTEKTWDGSINIEDKNIKLDLLGLLNFKEKLPEFDFTLNITDANLYKLNIDKLDSTSMVTMLLTSNFKGNSIDNLDGEIKLLNSNFRKYNNNLELYNLSIKTFEESDKPVLSLRTDFIDADIKGYYNFGTLSDLVKSTLNRLMPSQFHFKDLKIDPKKNNFTFNINFKNTDKIFTFLKTGLTISDKSYIKGAILGDSIINVSGKADMITVKKNTIDSLVFDTRVSGSDLKLNLSSNSVAILGQSELKDFSIGLNTTPDNFIFGIDWDNKDQGRNHGNLTAHGSVAKNNSESKYAVLNIDIDSTHVYSDGNNWKLSKAAVLIDSSTINVRNLSVKNKDRYYMVDGTISENPADTLHLGFNGIDIAPLNNLVNRKKDPSAVPFDFKGLLNGKILVSNVYKSLLLAGNIYVENFSVLGGDFGNISIKSELDNIKKIINLSASNNLHSMEVSGMYDPATRKIDLTAKTKKLPITFLNPLLKTFASEISGFASGKLNMAGRTDDFYFTGAAYVENAAMKITYLGTKYTLNDSIRFDKEGIKFNNIKISDVKGNNAVLSGYVNHKDFKDYTADLTITIGSTSFQVLNTVSKDNPLFYGTAYASGVARIKSDPNLLSFDVSAKTGKNTKLAIPLSKGLSVSENTYISFVDPNKSKDKNSRSDKPKPAPSKQVPMELNMNLEITPDAEIQIIFDSKVGDVMKGTGSSENLNINLSKKGDFTMSGDYVIEKGEYTFTLGNFFNKPFDVERGGKIMFNGNLKDAEIDLKANYLGLKASLATILGEGTNNQYSERVKVQPQLNLSGKLFNPIVGFDIYLPDSDEETRTLLRNYISGEDEMTKQVVSLLLMNSFISQGNNIPSGQNPNPSGSSAISATTLEMVSNQVSNWLSQLSKTVDIGLNIRPGYNSVSPPEAQVALSTQILNDKVVLNGNFDVRGPGTTFNPNGASSSANQLTGDFDVEVKLTEKFRFKVFNRYNETNAGTGLSPYTQGVGIFYKQDFNKFGDLFRKKNKSEMKKENETKIQKKSDGKSNPVNN